MVNDVEMGNVVEEEATLPAQNRPINGGGSSSLEVPLLAAIVGHDGVSVVQVSDHDD